MVKNTIILSLVVVLVVLPVPIVLLCMVLRLFSLKGKRSGGTCVNVGCVPKKGHVVWCSGC